LKLLYINKAIPDIRYKDLVETEQYSASGSTARKYFYQIHKDYIDKLTKFNIQRMIDITKKNNSLPILMTYHRAWVNDILRNLAQENNVLLIDNEKKFADSQISELVLQKDNWHPNKEGYEVIANNILNKFIEVDIFDKINLDLN